MVQCEDCKNFKKDKAIEASGEFMDNYGTCSMSGSVCKIRDECKNGLYEKLE